MSWLAFLFGNKKRIEGEVVDLLIDNQGKTSTSYAIYLHRQKQQVGECDLRIGTSKEFYYAGNIGYTIFTSKRGHHYAYYACLLLLHIAEEKGMERVYITCSPENHASYRTIKRLNGKYLKTVWVPRNHWLYQRNEKIKMVFQCETTRQV